MTIMNWFNESIVFITGHDWIMQIFLIVLASLSLNFVIRRMLGQALKRLESTKNPWDDLAVRSIQKPISLMIWLLGITFAADVLRIERERSPFLM